MSKRKVVTLVCSLALIGAMGVGATLAYFTDSAEVGNVIAMSHVDIKLAETIDGETEALTEEGLSFEKVLPGQTVEKDPTVYVQDGSADCYVRMAVEVSAEEGSTITAEDLDKLETALNAYILEDEYWYYNAEDEYYYYALRLSEGGSALLFDKVTIPGAWKNNTADQKFSIVISAEAIQADYTEDIIVLSEDEANVIEWKIVAEDIESYVAEEPVVSPVPSAEPQV